MSTPSWAIVATVDEPAPLIIAFAAYHLAVGASRVHLYLDAPNPEADWLLHADCDEFVQSPEKTMLLLEEAAPDIAFLRLHVGERVHLEGEAEDQIFDGVFRLPFDEYDTHWQPIYGNMAGFLKQEVTGHKAGKALVRTGRKDVIMGIHAPQGTLPRIQGSATRILHFDGLTRLHYQLKLLRRAFEQPSLQSERHGAPRMAQFTRLRDELGTPAGAEALVTRLKWLEPEQADILRLLKRLDEHRFDPRPDLARMGVQVDLSVAGFDAILRQRDAALIRQAGL